MSRNTKKADLTVNRGMSVNMNGNASDAKIRESRILRLAGTDNRPNFYDTSGPY